jgi:hypothetical protein
MDLNPKPRLTPALNSRKDAGDHTQGEEDPSGIASHNLEWDFDSKLIDIISDEELDRSSLELARSNSNDVSDGISGLGGAVSPSRRTR